MLEFENAVDKSISLADRIAGALWGQFVGDAFCLGSHWIYDLKELQQRFPGGPQGFERPVEGHYHFGKQPGDLTHYGDAALLLLRSLMERNRFDAADFGARFVAMNECPGYTGYRDHAAKGTVANYRAFREAHGDAAYSFQEGADDDQPATISRLVPLAAYAFQKRDFLAVVERATRVTQNNERAVAYAQVHAQVLRELFNGLGLTETFQSIAEQLGKGSEVAGKICAALASLNLPVSEATLKLGQSCPLANSFPAAIHCAVQFKDDFSGALRATAAAGGDSAARGAIIGAWLGAAHGTGVIPSAWREKLTARAEIAAGLEWLCGHLSE